MKKSYKHLLSTLCLALAVVTSCKDDDLQIIPEWETAVHGLGEFNAETADVNFIKGEPAVDLTIDLLWNSIDNQNTVTKIDLYILFNETYIDQDGNPKVASHGGSQGKLFKTLEGSSLPADKTPTTFSISQADVYALYSTQTYNYFGGGALPVWGEGSIREDRDTENFKFVDGDAFQLKWTLTTEDGRVFSFWGVSVCTEFPGANCAVNWAAVCSQVIKDPVGDWTINMVDSYGDGWNGAGVTAVVDGVSTKYTLENGKTGTTVVSVPEGTETLTWTFVSGDWDSEVSYEVVSPRGNVIAKGGPSPTPGTMTLNLCVDNE